MGDVRFFVPFKATFIGHGPPFAATAVGGAIIVVGAHAVAHAVVGSGARGGIAIVGVGADAVAARNAMGGVAVTDRAAPIVVGAVEQNLVGVIGGKEIAKAVGLQRVAVAAIWYFALEHWYFALMHRHRTPTH